MSIGKRTLLRGSHSPNVAQHFRLFLAAFLLLAPLLSPLLHAQPLDPALVPDRFTNIVLGTPADDVKLILESHPLFLYGGGPDISFTPFDQNPLIETEGTGFMESGIFQFRDERLYSIILHIDEAQIDYFTMYTHLREKYGEPEYLDPQRSYWEQSDVRMVLEKPVVMKYLDLNVFNRIREEGAARESILEYSRELFLDNF